jgi:MFS family permease
MLGWALLADAVPLYPLYALLFAESGLSGAQISGLFAIWSTVGLLAEVPSGALADRFGRRNALAAAGVLQALGYVSWTMLPSFAGFAVGFVLWGLGGTLVSGAQEALLYDGLVAAGAEVEYARVNGWVHATVLLAGLPAAVAATVLYPVGGFELVGWDSVGVCLGAAALAARLPESRPTGDPDPDPNGDPGGDPDATGAGGAEPGYLQTLRIGVAEAAARPGVRAAVLAAALVGGFDALEEYFPLITEGRGVPIVAVPLAMLPIGLAGAAGAALGGHADRLRPGLLAALLGAGMLLLGAGGLIDQPAGLAAVVLFYGCYRAVLVVVDARLQQRIESRSRATVTSVASLCVEVATFGIYAAWAVGEIGLVAAVGVLLAVVLPWLLRGGPRRPGSVRLSPERLDGDGTGRRGPAGVP